VSTTVVTKNIGALKDGMTIADADIEVGLLTGGIDRPYAFGLATELISKGVCLDVLGSDELDSPEMHASSRLRFLNLYGDTRKRVGLAGKMARMLLSYARLIRYAAVAEAKILHILWNNRIQLFDRTLLMAYYKLLGKKVVFTAHNVNAGKRDAKDSFLNRFSLRIQYRLADHIFVHTEKMKSELLAEFGVRSGAVSVIPFGINNSFPCTGLTAAEARQRLSVKRQEKTILFFGRLRPYKGLEYLVEAFQQIVATEGNYRLIIASEPKVGSEKYFHEIRQLISRDSNGRMVIQQFAFIPDEETELYFKAADVLILPYTDTSQSGVLFLSYSFGLPAIATNVGSFAEDISVGRTGFLCKPRDAEDLARTIKMYFAGDLYKDLDERRQEIIDYARSRNSWDTVGEITRDVYASLLGNGSPSPQ
jgi:glycosyltransferase involved in cell wall biosynthesis